MYIRYLIYTVITRNAHSESIGNLPVTIHEILPLAMERESAMF